MNIDNVLVSIIIPIFNCEKYLDRALESVRKQTYENLQIILVDDGSKDDSGEICDQYTRKDKRFMVIHKKNGGVSDARNVGIKYIQGDYVAFIDADDVLSPCYIESLLRVAVDSNSKIVTCDTEYCHGDSFLLCEETKIDFSIISLEDYDFMQDWSHATVWGALFHKDLIADTKFCKDIYVGEDSIFFSELLVKCNQIAHISNKLYYYFIYEVSLLHGKYDEKKLTEITAWERINQIVKDKGSKLDNSSKARLVRHALSGYKQVLSENEDDKEKMLCFLQNSIKKNINNYLKSNSGLKQKIESLMIIIFPGLYRIIYKKVKMKHY